MRTVSRSTTFVKAALFMVTVVFFAASCIKQSARLEPSITASATPEPIAQRASSKTFEDFSHKIKEHKQFDCVSCHQREGRSTKLDYTGHDSCIGCHLNQFIDPDQTAAMCSICHASLKTEKEKMKVFPARFIEGFNMKFDHGKHDSGAGRPPEGCSSCHQSSGPGKTIQTGIDTHSNCFSCHTAESKIGSCNVCHALGPYNRTAQSDYSFRYIFRHGDHTMACSDCHNVINGGAQGRQVTNITIKEHKTSAAGSCLQCHNGRGAFNGNDPTAITTCMRCHKDFVNTLPAGTAGATGEPATQ